MTLTIPPPPDTEEIPPTDPAPTPRLPAESLAEWPGEAVTAVECPHPHQSETSS